MKQVLRDGFRIFALDSVDELDNQRLQAFEEAYGRAGEGYEVPAMPMQIHDVLICRDVITDPGLTASGEECRWVSDQDWVYVACVPCGQSFAQAERKRLKCMGIDTIADIYWNRRLVCKSRDMFVPALAELPAQCGDQAWLVVHIHSPWNWLKKLEVPKRYEGKVMPKWSMIRGFYRGFDDYLGFPPYLTRMGIYDDLVLESGSQGFDEVVCQACLQPDKTVGRVKANGKLWNAATRDTKVKLSLYDGETIVAEGVAQLCEEKFQGELTIRAPKCWEVRGHGNPNCYRLNISLQNGMEALESVDRTVGFCTVERAGDMEFRLNGHALKLWGANLAPLDNKSGCYDPRRGESILCRAAEANMNCIRVWGGGDRLPDSFYDLCDQYGILVWQDFFHDYSMYPDTAEFRALCRGEAEYQIKRLKHHPSILLWCGSNESIMCRDFSNPGEECVGYEIYQEDYRQLCAEWDPDRYYHLSSPSGGAFANDPRQGDTHSYTSNWFVPGGKIPVFLSENMRAFPPAYRSMVRMMGREQLWPEGYTGQMPKGSRFPWPPTWRRFTSAESWEKISEVEQFFDATDAESMIYRFQASVGRYIADCVGRYRRGRGWEARFAQGRRCNGHLWWKLNTSAPHIYSGLLDYYLEPSLPYFALKRAYEPFQVFLSCDDELGIWAVNDTPAVVRGNVSVKLLNIQTNRVVQTLEAPFETLPDQSLFVMNLNGFGQFLMNRHVLAIKAVDQQGKILCEHVGYADIERHYLFPQCKLRLGWEREELIVETDCFARCVELIGQSAEGDQFGWSFSDNYFDVVPGQIKRIRVGGAHKQGKIYAKGYYSDDGSAIVYPPQKG